ncbi:unnamed protein product [Calypogeia fissa]
MFAANPLESVFHRPSMIVTPGILFCLAAAAAGLGLATASDEQDCWHHWSPTNSSRPLSSSSAADRRSFDNSIPYVRREKVGAKARRRVLQKTRGMPTLRTWLSHPRCKAKADPNPLSRRKPGGAAMAFYAGRLTGTMSELSSRAWGGRAGLGEAWRAAGLAPV